MPTGNMDTLLVIAAKRGELAIVQSLLDKGEHVDAIDNAGRTALHHAVQTASDKLVKLLLDRGADVNLKTANGYTTPLHCALCAPYLQFIVEPPNSTALTTQLGRGFAIVKILIDGGADVRATTKLGKTPEELAVGGGDMEVLALVRAAVKRRCVRELQALVAPNPPQGVLVRGHAGLVINQLSRRVEGDLIHHYTTSMTTRDD